MLDAIFDLREQWSTRKLNAFVKEYNELRPHDGLGMKTPAAVHIISDRPYPESIEEWIYPKDFLVCYVSRNGAVRIGMKNLKVYDIMIYRNELDV